MSTLLHLAEVVGEKNDKIWIRDPKDRFLVLHRPSGIWYVRAKKKGKKPLFKTTGHEAKGKAKTKALLMLAEWMGTRPPESDVILYRDFLPSYREFIQNHTKLRPRTKQLAKFYLSKLDEEMGHLDIRRINEGFFDEWLEDYRRRSKRTTFMDFAKYLGKSLRHAHRKGLIDRLPEFRNPDSKKVTGRCYTRSEVTELFHVADQRLELQLRLALQCFMRLREMLFLTWDRVDLKARLIRLGADDVKTGSKTGEGREFHFNDEIHYLLITLCGKSRFVFPSPRNPDKATWSNKTAWRKAKKRAGVRGRARWHDLRHTALVWALVGDDEQQKLPSDQRKLLNPLLVSKYAGVSMKTIESVYLKGKVSATHTREVAFGIQV